MDFSSLNLFSGLAARMRFLSARSNIIAQNIANADTPGYHAKKISEPDFGRLIEGTYTEKNNQMRTSSERHQSPSASSSFGPVRENRAEVSLDDNSVSIETETMRLSQTRMEYGLASTVYRKGLDIVRLAVRSDR